MIDIERGARGSINTPCFTLDGQRLAAPTLWLMDESCFNTRNKYASNLRDFLNEYLEGMSNDERTNIDHSFWQSIDRDTVQGYFYSVLLDERGLKKTSILNIKAAIQSFYRAAEVNGWTSKQYSNLFNNMSDIEEETQTDLRSQYLEYDLYQVIIKQILQSHRNKETKNIDQKGINSTPFLQSRDYLVMELGYSGGFRANEAMQLHVEQLLPKLEEVEENGVIKKAIRIRLVRKGGKSKELDISNYLGQQIYNFITKERSSQAKLQFGAQHKGGRTGPLISSITGEKMSVRYPTKLFKSLRCVALEDIIDLLHTVEKDSKCGWWLSLDQIIGDPNQHKSALSYHSLRHTYLTNLAGSNPLDLDYVRQQAGHAKGDTTFNIYVEFTVMRDKHSYIRS
ncbi:site-specific integrase [Paraglaciecola sp. 25GB23A]|uniref:tyrosine-type recombinase/integrase n=1 Tax=Paraglaciecola sp. 25GB23A TaxID=3156068 RepID=UPI0032AF4EB0